MLTLRPKSWTSWDFRILAGDEEIARIDRRWLRETASFSLDGVSYDVRRTSVFRGTFQLERDGTVLARAAKPSPFRRTFDIRVGAEPYRLEATSFLRRDYRLLRAGVRVGSIRPVSSFRRAAMADLPDQLPRPVQLFVIFLVLVLWKRASDAAAAAG